MLANARSAGYVFNPLSLFWCHDPSGALVCVVAEVHNTYGQRHRYLLRTDDAGRVDTEKEFYVSPFYPVDGYYRMSLPEPGERLAVTITLHRDRRAAVHRLGARRAPPGRPCAPCSPPRCAARSRPAGSALLITAHGIRLWRKGLPVQPRPPHPSDPSQETPMNIADDLAAPDPADGRHRPAGPAARVGRQRGRAGRRPGARHPLAPRAAPAAVGAGRARPGPRLRDRRHRRRGRPRRRLPPGLELARSRPQTGGPTRRRRARRRPRSPRPGSARSALPPKPPASEARLTRRPAQPAARPRRDLAPLRPVQRVLRAAAGRDDGVLVGVLHARGPAAGRRAAREARPDLPQARPQAGHAAARRRLRLGLADPARRRALRRARHRHHARRPAARLHRQARRRARSRRPGRGAPAGLPRVRRDRRVLRRGQLDRDGRARRRGQLPRVRRDHVPRAASGRSRAAAADVAPGGDGRPAAARSSRATSRRTCTCARSGRRPATS